MFSNPNHSQTFASATDSPLHLYGAHKMSPAYSAPTTPLNVSPTSPRNPHMLPQLPLSTRQIRPPKSPMYVPAVLRPTERPYRPSPLTPPRSMHGSTDSLEGDNFTHSGSPSRTSTSDSKSKDIRDEGIEEGPTLSPPLSDVTGLPTRQHWKPDANATICDAPICQKSFSLFERRHHCRHCGHVFCNTHSHFTVPLDQEAEFHPQGAESRACKHCWDQYTRWRKERVSRHNSISSGSTTLPSTPNIGLAGAARRGSEGPKSPLAASVPRDWNWSTF